jgi:hypothetical protein
VLALIHGGAGLPETVVWVEACADLRARLLDLLTDGVRQLPELQRWREHGHLRFRCAPAADPAVRARALERALAEMAQAPAR